MGDSVQHMAQSGTGSLLVLEQGSYVFVQGAGIWSPDYVDQHFGKLGAMLDGVRAQRGGARVLVDLTRAVVQAPETAARVQHWTSAIYRPEDRVAIVVASSLMKVQMRRSAIIAQRELFLSKPAALTWLLADPHPAGQRLDAVQAG